MVIPNQKRLLNQFVQQNKTELSHLALALRKEWGESNDCLGIDLLPRPHFVRCNREAIETLNLKVDSKIQEILGILDGYNPDEEIVIIAIGKSEIELIYYKIENFSEPSGNSIDNLIQLLEARMSEIF